MKTINTQHYIEFHSSDSNGEFIVRICKINNSRNNLFQLQLKASGGDDDAYVDLDRKELLEIRNIIDTSLFAVPQSGNVKNLGIATTIGELKKLIAEYPDNISFGFRNQPMQQLMEVNSDNQKFIVFNEIGV